MPNLAPRKLSIFCLALASLFWFGTAGATSRIKDLADFEGIRENQLVG